MHGDHIENLVNPIQTINAIPICFQEVIVINVETKEVVKLTNGKFPYSLSLTFSGTLGVTVSLRGFTHILTRVHMLVGKNAV